ncbi:MAG: hypothetical protein OXH22_08535 [Chloroflexi bacterium]|nr:hypothetical protein [Chloroflexota bacterium]
MNRQNDKSAKFESVELEPVKKRPLSADMLGAEAAMKRAAKKARKRAIENTGYVATWRDGKIVYDTEV